ncbi:hypothetical protein ACJ41O_012372 [Fusarium nematophilum]
MRLLNTTTLQLESFIGDDSRPEYSILSHTWGAEEVLYEDMGTGSPGSLSTTKAGRAKIIESCARAEQDGFQYIWIDTCCIDKSSSAELSEAINSMFRWYRDARLCYAYLIDITSKDPGDEFGASRWFTRGWTLQELISPPEIHFYNQTWSRIGTRHGLAERISNITGIGVRVLSRAVQDSVTLLRMELNVTSVSTRMSWAAERVTTRVEDMAYCLMGVFDVNMPLLYGEGHKAFRRLQEEIVTNLDDQSILAWTPRTHDEVGPNFFAPSPRVNFETGVSAYPQSHHPHSLTLSNKGLEVDVLLGFASFEGYDRWVAILNCHSTDDFLTRPVYLLRQYLVKTRYT